MPTQDPIHDHTRQEKFFGYGSTLFGDSTRLTYMAGAFVGHFQIPDLLGQEPLGDFGPSTLVFSHPQRKRNRPLLLRPPRAADAP